MRRRKRDKAKTPAPPPEAAGHDYEEVENPDHPYEEMEDQKTPSAKASQGTLNRHRLKARPAATAMAYASPAPDPNRRDTPDQEYVREKRASDVWNTLSDMKFAKGEVDLNEVREVQQKMNEVEGADEDDYADPTDAVDNSPVSPVDAFCTAATAYEVPAALFSPPWVHGAITREEATSFVSDPSRGGDRPGAFLFRRKNQVDTYAITLFLAKGQMIHHKLELTERYSAGGCHDSFLHRGWIFNGELDTPVQGPQASLPEVLEMLKDRRGRWQLNLQHPISSHRRVSGATRRVSIV